VDDDLYAVIAAGQLWGETFRSPMRWLLIVMMFSVFALLVVSAGMAVHIWRQHRKPATPAGTSAQEKGDVESEEAP
jgi:hypothetical protein